MLAGVAHDLLDAPFPHITVTTEDLQAVAAAMKGLVREHRFHDRCDQGAPALRSGLGVGVLAVFDQVELERSTVGQHATGIHPAALRVQNAAHGRVFCNQICFASPLAFAGRTHLAALLRIGVSLLPGGVQQADALQELLAEVGDELRGRLCNEQDGIDDLDRVAGDEGAGDHRLATPGTAGRASPAAAWHTGRLASSPRRRSPGYYLALPFVYTPHSAHEWLLLVGLGFSGAVVQLSLTGALRLAPVAVVIPMDYSALLWSIACGWWFFGTLPADTTWVGAPLIVASGLFIAWREHRRHIDRPKEVAA